METTNKVEWHFLIDSKEQKGKILCEELKVAKNGIPNAMVSDLAVADYWFTLGGKVWCAIERKKLDDLSASIIDGRYSDQSARMVKSDIPHIFFMVVGSWYRVSESAKTRMRSALLHLQMQRNIKVCYVDNEEEAKSFFIKLHSYLCEDPSLERLTGPLEEHIQTTCRKRKLNTQPDVYRAMLMCVDGVSEDRAIAIAAEWPNLPELMKGYIGCGNDKEAGRMLEDIAINGRRLGEKVSQRIYSCIMAKEQKPDSKSRKKEK